MTTRTPSRTKAKRVKMAKRGLSELFNVFVSLIIIIPLLFILLNSFKDSANASKLTLNLDGVSLQNAVENYRFVFEKGNLVPSMMNSFIAVSFSSFFVILLSSMTAFIAARRGTKGMKRMSNVIIAGLTLPGAMVTMYSLLYKIGLAGGNMSMIGAILLYIATGIPFAFFLFLGYIKGVSSEIDEAAIIDGVSPPGLFFRIIMPLLIPVTVTVLIAEAMSVWNDFTVALYFLNDAKRSTAVLSTYLFKGIYSTAWHYMFADIILISLPIIILYVLLQKYFIGGLTAGAVKG